MYRTCAIVLLGISLAFMLMPLPGGKVCGIMNAYAEELPSSSENPIPFSLMDNSSELIPLPQIIRPYEDTTQTESPYLSGLSSTSRCSTKVGQTTRGLGNLQIEASSGFSEPAPLSNRRDEKEGLFFLRHSGLLRRGGWRLEQAIGDQNANLGEDILSSDHFTFTQTKMRGISGVAHNGSTQLSWAFGNVGKLVGSDTSHLEVTDDMLSGVGVSQRIDHHWQLSAQLWTVSDKEATKYQSLATAAQYTDPENQYDYSMHLINDSNRGVGVWFDMNINRDRWHHIYSLYRFSPNLLWSTVTLPDDKQGAYWKTEYTLSDTVWSGGFELEQTNLDQDITREGHVKSRGFGSVTRTLDERMSLQGQLQAEDSRSYAGLTTDETQAVRLGLSLARQLDIGLSRFDVLWTSTLSELSPQETWHLCWDQDWQFKDIINKITTRLAVDRRTNEESEVIYPAAAFILSHPVFRQVEFVSSLYYVVDTASAPNNMKPADWCNGQLGCSHGTGGSVWLAMRAPLDY